MFHLQAVCVSLINMTHVYTIPYLTLSSLCAVLSDQKIIPWELFLKPHFPFSLDIGILSKTTFSALTYPRTKRIISLDRTNIHSLVWTPFSENPNQ